RDAEVGDRGVDDRVVVHVVGAPAGAAGRGQAERVDVQQRAARGSAAARIDPGAGAVAAEAGVGEEGGVGDGGRAEVLADADVAQHERVVGRVGRVEALLQ